MEVLRYSNYSKLIHWQWGHWVHGNALRITGLSWGLPTGDQWTSNVEFWYLFCLLAWTAVEQTVGPPMILYVVMIPIMIMIMIMMIIIIIIINIVLIIIITIITIYTVRNNQTLTDLRASPDCHAPEKKPVGNNNSTICCFCCHSLLHL